MNIKPYLISVLFVRSPLCQCISVLFVRSPLCQCIQSCDLILSTCTLLLNGHDHDCAIIFFLELQGDAIHIIQYVGACF